MQFSSPFLHGGRVAAETPSTVSIIWDEMVRRRRSVPVRKSKAYRGISQEAATYLSHLELCHMTTSGWKLAKKKDLRVFNLLSLLA